MNSGYFIAALIGAVITFLALETCRETPKPETKTITRDSLVIIHDTVFKGEGKGKLKYTYAPVSGGVLQRKVIAGTTDTTLTPSPLICDTITGFIATLDTIQNRDTLHLEYSYPASLFRYRLSRQADSIILKNRETTVTTYIESPWYDQTKYSVPIVVLVMFGIFAVSR